MNSSDDGQVMGGLWVTFTGVRQKTRTILAHGTQVHNKSVAILAHSTIAHQVTWAPTSTGMPEHQKSSQHDVCSAQKFQEWQGVCRAWAAVT